MESCQATNRKNAFERINITLPRSLAEEIRESCKRHYNMSFSGWLRDTAIARIAEEKAEEKKGNAT